MRVSAEGPREVVTDKGYHSRAVVSELTEWGVPHVLLGAESRTAAWPEQEREQQAVYANRQRIRGERGLRLLAGNAARNWNDGINIYMIARECAEFICVAGKTFSSGWWFTRAQPISGC